MPPERSDGEELTFEKMMDLIDQEKSVTAATEEEHPAGEGKWLMMAVAHI